MRSGFLAYTLFAAAQPLLAAGGSDRVELLDGGAIEGLILKETVSTLYIDVGYDVLRVPMDSIHEIIPAEEEGDQAPEAVTAEPNEFRSDDLYRTGDLPERGLDELSDRFGEGVVKVSTPGGLGSGFIVHEDGYAITNFHVIENETQISINIFRKVGQAFRNEKIDDVQIIAVNPFYDLALLKFTPPEGLDITVMYLAADRDLHDGDSVFAIGNPLGLERTISRGIVSKRNRAEEGLVYIQTTTEINPGNSGGPLFNERGEVIGVTNMGYLFAEGLNFAIPVRYVIDFLENRDAYAYDRDNPNSGVQYLAAPPRLNPAPPEFLKPAATELDTRKPAEQG